MAILKRIGPVSLGKLQAVMMGFGGLVAGVFYALASAFIGSMTGNAAFGAQAGLLMLILMPFIYAAMGFVIGAATAIIYNFLASWVGGIEMEFDVVPQKEQAAPEQPAQAAYLRPAPAPQMPKR